MTRVLAFFGAFNPPTRAHLAVARAAMEQSGAQGVLFVPSKSDYIKNAQRKDFAFTDEERLRLLKRLAAERDWMSVTDIEIRSEKQPRTFETLRRLKEMGYEPRLLIGSDNLKDMSGKWRFVDEILSEFGVVCAARGGDDCESIIAQSSCLSVRRDKIQIIAAPEDLRSVSSSLVREKLAQMIELRRGLAALVPEEILNEIQYSFAEDTDKEGK